MPIRYRITKRRNNITANNEQNYIMQAVSTGTVDLDMLSYEISKESTLSKVDVKAVLWALGEKLEFHLKDGKTIDIENIGKFKIGFKSIAAAEINNLSPQKSIVKYHLNFQPAVTIKRWLKKGIKTYKEGSSST
jgi:predicted histone-like DNA-binding protein